MKTAIIYARVSSASQAEEEVSIPAQLDVGRKRAARDDVTLLREFVDEGRSAYVESNRPDFEAAIDYAVTHQVDIFYTWSSSRFARNKLEAAKFKRELERGGVLLVYLSMNIDLRSDEGWLLDSFFEIIDEQRSRDTSKDTRRSLIHNAQQGYWVGGMAPFGYASIAAPDNPRRRKLIELQAEADIAREVFAMRVSGLGGKTIAEHFNTAGMRYRGRKWNKAAVLHMLRNRVMIGETIFNKREPRTKRDRPESEWLVLHTHTPVIDAALWESAQAVMDDAAMPHVGKGRTRSRHPYTGLLRCGSCGGGLTVETASGRGGKYNYYSCRLAKQGSGCVIARYPADELDAALNDFVFERLLSPATLKEFALELGRIAKQHDKKTEARRHEISTNIAAIKQRNSRLYDILELHGREAPDLSDLTGRLRANNAELRALEDAAVRIESEAAAPVDLAGVDFTELGRQLRSMLTDSASVHQLRAFYSSFIESITIAGDTASIQYDQNRLVAATSPAVHRLQIWGRGYFFTRTASMTLPVRARSRAGASRRGVLVVGSPGGL